MWVPPSLRLQRGRRHSRLCGSRASACKGCVAPTASQCSRSVGTNPSELKHGAVSSSERREAEGPGAQHGPVPIPGASVRGPSTWGCLGAGAAAVRPLVCLGSCCSQAEREYSKGKCLKAVERIHIYGEKYLFFSNFPFPSPESTYQFSKCCKAHYFPPCHIIHPSIKDGS